MNLLGDCHQAELELLPSLDHSAALVSDVLQGGRDVDLLAALGHPVQDHVDQDVRSGSTDAVAAVHDDGAGATAIRLVDFSSEFKESFG